MNIVKCLTFLLILSSQCVLGQSASDRLDAIASGSHGVGKKGKLDANQLPKLNIHWQCVECSGNDKVIPLIERAYEEHAHDKQYMISDAEIADIVIKDYQQRNPGARATLGSLAGQDLLSTEVHFRGRTIIVADYSSNSWLGMNYLCRSVATKAFKEIVATPKESQLRTRD